MDFAEQSSGLLLNASVIVKVHSPQGAQLALLRFLDAAFKSACPAHAAASQELHATSGGHH